MNAERLSSGWRNTKPTAFKQSSSISKPTTDPAMDRCSRHPSRCEAGESMEAKPTAREILSRELMKIFAQTHSRVRMIDPVRGWTDHKFLEPHDQKFFTVFNGDRPSDLNLCCARSGWGYEVR